MRASPGRRTSTPSPPPTAAVVSRRCRWAARRTLLARVAALRASRRLVVADLPASREGLADLRALSAARAAGELLLVVQRAPDARRIRAAVGRRRGLAGGAAQRAALADDERARPDRGDRPRADDPAPARAGADCRPTCAARRSRPMGRCDSSSLRALMAPPARDRGAAPEGARLPAAGAGRCCWRSRRRSAAGAAWALRVGALGVLWAPVAVLIPAALEPSAPVEYAMIALACMALGALTDLLLGWPRAPIAPGARRRARAERRRARGDAAADALAARPRPDPRRALLRDRQRAEVGAGRARARRASPPPCTPPCAGAGRRCRWRSRASCSPPSRARRGSAPASAG